MSEALTSVKEVLTGLIGGHELAIQLEKAVLEKLESNISTLVIGEPLVGESWRWIRQRSESKGSVRRWEEELRSFRLCVDLIDKELT